MKSVAWGGFLLLFFYAFPAGAEPTIEVFSDERFPITGIDSVRERFGIEVTNYDLGAPKRWTAEMSVNLPVVPQQAKAVLLSRFEKIGMDKVKQSLQEAYIGHMKAYQYAITRYPAIVFDQGKSVVYGVVNLPQALRIYQNGSHPNE